MAKYHINLEGKILPCRARVKKCPYSEGSHGDSYEELYEKVINEYSEIQVSREIRDKLESGEHITGLSLVSHEIEDSSAPIELIISVLDKAKREAYSYKTPNSIISARENIIDKAAQTIEANRFFVNSRWGLSKDMEREARALATKNYNSRGFFEKSKFNTANLAKKTEDELMSMRPTIDKVINWERSHKTKYEYTDEETSSYVGWLTSEYNYFSKSLNTSKLISQPDWANSQHLEMVNENLRGLDNPELLAMYDDLTVSDKEVTDNLNSLNFFEYKERRDLSDKANRNLEKWYLKNKNKADEFILKSSGRVLLSMRVAKELTMRDINFGDVIRATKERGELG